MVPTCPSCCPARVTMSTESSVVRLPLIPTASFTCTRIRMSTACGCIFITAISRMRPTSSVSFNRVQPEEIYNVAAQSRALETPQRETTPFLPTRGETFVTRKIMRGRGHAMRSSRAVCIWATSSSGPTSSMPPGAVGTQVAVPGLERLPKSRG